MDKFLIELIVAIREIKEILNLHNEEIERLKEVNVPRQSDTVDERLVKLALEGSKNLYLQRVENKLEKKLRELECAVSELSQKIGTTGPPEEIKVTEEHLNKLRRALAE